jgi:hypothetical protein
MKMKIKIQTSAAPFLTTAIALATISGCAVSDPDRHYKPQADDAKVIFRSVNMPMSVDFSVSSNTAVCKGFERVGLVRDEGRGVLLPWIVNLTGKFNKVPGQLQAPVPGDSLIQVKGFGSWEGGSCGPVAASFSTQKGDAYLVEFVWVGTSSCSLRVSDVTVPGDAKPVVVSYRLCPRAMLGD